MDVAIIVLFESLKKNENLKQYFLNKVTYGFILPTEQIDIHAYEATWTRMSF